MNQQTLFLLADADLRRVIDRLEPQHLAVAAPEGWTRSGAATLREVLASHVYDEAWVPDVVAGRTIDEVGDRWAGDLLGDDPIGAYDRAHDAAAAALAEPLDLEAIVHLSYGDFPLSVYLEHTMYYRTFQAWSIANLLEFDFHLAPDLVSGVRQIVEPQLEGLRAIHVFGPAIEVPADADEETRLLATTGFWAPRGTGAPS